MRWQVRLIQDSISLEYKVLEVNGRIPSGIKICTLCGHDIIKLMLEDLLQKDVTNFGYNTIEGIRLEYFTRDIKCTHNVFKNIIEFILDKNLYEYIFSIKDPIPFICHLIYQLLEKVGLK